MSAQDYIYCYQGKALRVGGDTAVIGSITLPPVQPKTLRFKFYDSFDPTTLQDMTYIGMTWTKVSGTIYDWSFTNSVWTQSLAPAGSGSIFNYYAYKEGANWVFPTNNHDFDIIDSDLTGVTDITKLFTGARNVHKCVLKNTQSIVNATDALSGGNRPSKLESINVFDTSSCTSMMGMFRLCTSLVTVPLLDTSSCTNMDHMFESCTNIQSGALALYQQASTQATPPSSHYGTFTNCGSNTVTGAAELAQIPTSWGGTMAE